MMRSSGSRGFSLLGAVLLNVLAGNAQVYPDDASVAAPPQSVYLDLTEGTRGEAGTSAYALLLSGLGPATVRIGADGWTVRTYSEGTFELRPLLPSDGSTLGGVLGDVCGTGQVLILRARSNESLGEGTLSAGLALVTAGPLGPAGETAAISGGWSPASDPIPYGSRIYWQATLMNSLSAIEAHSWGGIKSAFR